MFIRSIFAFITFSVALTVYSSQASAAAFVRLERATASEVNEVFHKRMSGELDGCFANYKEEHNKKAKLITTKVLDEFRTTYSYSQAKHKCHEAFDLRTIIKEIFTQKNRKQAKPEVIKGWLKDWGLTQLESSSAKGYVTFKDLPLVFYYDVVRTRKMNSMKREKTPAGVDLKMIRELWPSIGHQGLDKDFLNTVLITGKVKSHNDLLRTIRKAFALRKGTLVTGGAAAIDEFWNAGEGPDGDPQFAAIADQLSSPSITKAFYFFDGAGGSFPWSRNTLILVDNYNQMFGFSMGYSE